MKKILEEVRAVRLTATALKNFREWHGSLVGDDELVMLGDTPTGAFIFYDDDVKNGYFVDYDDTVAIDASDVIEVYDCYRGLYPIAEYLEGDFSDARNYEWGTK
jgi:hypothetical protein